MKNWNHPIETTTNKWIIEAPWAPIPWKYDMCIYIYRGTHTCSIESNNIGPLFSTLCWLYIQYIYTVNRMYISILFITKWRYKDNNLYCHCWKIPPNQLSFVGPKVIFHQNSSPKCISDRMFNHFMAFLFQSEDHNEKWRKATFCRVLSR